MSNKNVLFCINNPNKKIGFVNQFLLAIGKQIKPNKKCICNVYIEDKIQYN